MPCVRVGEGAVLKTVGLKGLAGSNPVHGASNYFGGVIMSRGKPHPYVEKEFKYMRKSALAWYDGHIIAQWFYDKLSKYYARKYERKIMSR